MKIVYKFLFLIISLFSIFLLPADSKLAVVLVSVLFVIVVPLFIFILIALLRDLQMFSAILTNPYSSLKYKNITVNFLWKLNGGGIMLSHEYVRLVKKRIGKVEHVFEFCAGPGFIGFHLLDSGLCDRLTVADVNPKAVAALRKTVKDNGLEDRVQVYESDCLDSIPESEQWDLVVGNPPWYLCSKRGKDLKIHDPEARVHIKFYQDINKFLKPSGIILMVEGGEFTNEKDFKKMIDSNGLKVKELIKPGSILKLFNDRKEYVDISLSMYVFLKVGSWFREVYYLWIERR